MTAESGIETMMRMLKIPYLSSLFSTAAAAQTEGEASLQQAEAR